MKQQPIRVRLSKPDPCVGCLKPSKYGEVVEYNGPKEVGWCAPCWMRQTRPGREPLRLVAGSHAA